MPQLSVFQQADFPAVYKWQALAFMRVEWPEIFTGPIVYETETTPAELQPVRFVLAEGELLLSFAEVISVDLTLAGEHYRVGGLSNLFTFPACRRAGFGGQIVAAATAYIRQNAFDLGILFCDAGMEKFYAAAGWETLPGSRTRIGLPELSSVGDDHDRMLFLFVSEHGRRGRAVFASQPLYIEAPW